MSYEESYRRMHMNQAPVTKFLVFFNVGIHLIRLLYVPLDPTSWDWIMLEFGIIPKAFWAGAVWQPLTAMFLHANFIHILANMVSLWSIGQGLERMIGSRKFAWLYFVSGFMSSLFVLIFQYNVMNPTLGASGAIVGLLGALGIFFPKMMLQVFLFPMRAWTAVVLFGLISLGFILYDQITGSTSVFSHFGHLGGLVGGILYAKIVFKLPFPGRTSGTASRPEVQVDRKDTYMDEELQKLMRQVYGSQKREEEEGRTSEDTHEPFNTPIREEPRKPGSHNVNIVIKDGKIFFKRD